MADAAVALRPDMKARELQVTLTGKLVDRRQNNGVYYNTLLLAAADQFSQPMPFEVRSKKPIGGRDEIVTVDCIIGGFYKKSYVADKGTPDERTVRPIVQTLDVVESPDARSF